MANLYLILDLKENKLYDDNGKMSYDFEGWEYHFGSKYFELDELIIDYDAISDFIFEPDYTTDNFDVKIEDGDVYRVDVYNDKSRYLEPPLEDALIDFLKDKDLPDGDYSGKFKFYYDFGEDEFVCEVLEVDK